MKNKLKQFEKVLVVLSSGKVITKDELVTTLKDQIWPERMSLYMWEIKNKSSGNIKTFKNGREVVSYQLVNAENFKNMSHILETGQVVVKVGLPTLKELAMAASKKKKVTKKVVVKNTKKKTAVVVVKKTKKVKEPIIIEVPPEVSANNSVDLMIDPDFDAANDDLRDIPSFLKK